MYTFFLNFTIIFIDYQEPANNDHRLAESVAPDHDVTGDTPYESDICYQKH